MNEMTNIQTRTPELVAAEIRALTASMLNDVIEIGRRMCEAKDMIPYGEFGEWIKENTGYSSSTANNFMNLYREYGDRQSSLFGTEAESQTIGKLSYSKALALLSVPAEERESFAQTVDAEHISTRELKAAIKERDEALKAAQDAQAQNEQFLRQQEAASEQVRELQGKLNEARDTIKELESRPVEVAVEVDQGAIDEAVAAAEAKAKAAIDKEKARSEKLENQLKAAEEKAAEAEKSSDHEAETYKREAETLRKQLAMSDEAVVTFKLRFALWQNAYKEMKQALNGLEDPVLTNMRAAVLAQIAAWTSELDNAAAG